MQQRKLGVHGLVQELGATEDRARKGISVKLREFWRKNENEKANFLEANCHEICLPSVSTELALIELNQTINVS